MKKHNKLILVSFVLFFILSAAGVFAQVTPITNSSQQAEMPFVLVLPNGDVLLTYNEGAGFGIDSVIYYTIYSKSTGSWSSHKVAAGGRLSAAYSQLALDKYGIVHMAYYDGDASFNREIFYTNYDPETDTWANPQLVYASPGANSSWSRIRVEDDLIYIVWTHNYDPSIGLTDVVMVVNEIGGSWPRPNQDRITVSNTGQSASVHNFFDVKDRKVYATWIDDNHHVDNWSIYYSEGDYNPTTDTWNFYPSEYLFPTGENQYYPGLTVDDSGTPHIIFSHKGGPFFHTRKVGGTWTAPRAVSRGLAQFNLIAFVTFKQGLLHTAWVESTSGGESMFYGRGLPDGTWAEPIKLGDGLMPGYPCIDVDDDSVVHVVWSDGPPLDDDHRNVKYARVQLPGIPPTADIQASPEAGLIPLTVNFNASASSDPDGNIIDYRWDYGDGTSGRGAVVSHTFTQKGKYDVLLSVIDNDLRVGTAKTTIVASTGDPIALFDASATSGMAPFFVTYDASISVDADGIIVAYDWNFGDGTTGSGESVSHSYHTGGTYTVTLTVTDNDGKTDSTTQTIVVFEKPMADFTTSSDYGPQPHQVDFNASASSDNDGTIVSYDWDFGDGLTGQGQTIGHTYSSPGNFLAVLTVTDNDGYTGTAAKTITVTPRPAAPLNVSVELLENRSFLHTEYINRITWAENPQNAGISIAAYRIYRKPKGAAVDQYTQVGEVGGSTFQYDDRMFSSLQNALNNDYTITAVDDQGLESFLPSSSGSGFFGTFLQKIKRQIGSLF